MVIQLGTVRKALEEHLYAINENTTEIQVMFDYLQEVETKVDKLSRRLDQLQLSQDLPADKPLIRPLNHLEKSFFLILYTEENPLTIEELASKSTNSPALAAECLSSLAHKGIPIHRSFTNNQFFFSIEKQFKELQAKENVVNFSLQSFM